MFIEFSFYFVEIDLILFPVTSERDDQIRGFFLGGGYIIKWKKNNQNNLSK